MKKEEIINSTTTEEIHITLQNIAEVIPFIKSWTDYWKKERKLQLLINGIKNKSTNNRIESSFSQKKSIVSFTTLHEHLKIIITEQEKAFDLLSNAIEHDIENSYRMDYIGHLQKCNKRKFLIRKSHKMNKISSSSGRAPDTVQKLNTKCKSEEKKGKEKKNNDDNTTKTKTRTERRRVRSRKNIEEIN